MVQWKTWCLQFSIVIIKVLLGDIYRVFILPGVLRGLTHFILILALIIRGCYLQFGREGVEAEMVTNLPRVI